MDIFTTAYTRRVILPIKPDKLKVKALRKESATTELSEDTSHLEEHNQYVLDSRKQDESKHGESEGEFYQEKEIESESDQLLEGEGDNTHKLDIYV